MRRLAARLKRNMCSSSLRLAILYPRQQQKATKDWIECGGRAFAAARAEQRSATGLGNAPLTCEKKAFNRRLDGWNYWMTDELNFIPGWQSKTLNWVNDCTVIIHGWSFGIHQCAWQHFVHEKQFLFCDLLHCVVHLCIFI